MYEVIVVKHDDKDKIELQRVDDTFYIVVGYECDPLEVRKMTYNFAGFNLGRITFETHLPENKDTTNNLYLLSRLRSTYL